MACPAPARLAAAASGADVLATEHAALCTECASSIAAQRDLAAHARATLRPPAPLSDARRRALAAEVMAHADSDDMVGASAADVPSVRRNILIAVGALAAAALVLVVIEQRGPRAFAPTIELAAFEPTQPITEHQTAALDPAPADERRPAELVSRGADFVREQRDWADVITLRSGELAIDARNREPVTVIAGDTRVRIAKARVTVVARNSVIVTTHVFAGSAELTRGSHRQVLSTGEIWTPPSQPAEPTSPTASLDAFRTGWKALHAERYADAIAAFDRATDPVVLEDATFWAAIACERAGKPDEAARRLRSFIERFPASPRLDTARAALARVRP